VAPTKGATKQLAPQLYAANLSPGRSVASSVSLTTIDQDPKDLIKAATTNHGPAETLSSLTGIGVTIRGQNPDGLKNGIRQWRRWLADQDIKTDIRDIK
jgi:hypothetical protein